MNNSAACLPPGKKFNFFIDDNVFFFTDLYKERPRSIFEQFYLDNLRKIHRKYATKITLNCFFRNDHEEFTLAQFPDCYRAEFEENSDWLRLAFHAWSEQPSFPYLKEFPEKLPEHYQLLMRELERIAGKPSLIAPVIIHFYSTTPENRQFLCQQGMRFFAERQSPGYCYHPDLDAWEHPVTLFLNQHDGEKIAAILKENVQAEKPYLCIGSHEQYAYPRYKAYQPKYFDGIDIALQILQENNYESVFFNLLFTAK